MKRHVHSGEGLSLSMLSFVCFSACIFSYFFFAVSSTTNISYIYFLLTVNTLFLGIFNLICYSLLLCILICYFVYLQFNLFCEDFDQVFSTFKVSAGMPLLCRYSLSHSFFLRLFKCLYQWKNLVVIYFLLGLNYLE